MTDRITFEVEGPPKPWQRAGRMGRRTFSRNGPYQKQIAWAAMAAVSEAGGKWPTDARYVLAVDAYFPDLRKRDIDNIAKQVMDALNRVLWADDEQVDRLRVGQWLDRSRPRLRVSVQPTELSV